jgi:hypothetical protein
MYTRCNWNYFVGFRQGESTNMQQQIKGPVLAAILVVVLVIVGVIAYFTVFHQEKNGPEEILAHQGQGYPGGRPAATPGGGAAPGGKAP